MPESSVRCPRCGASVASNEARCPSCDAALPLRERRSTSPGARPRPAGRPSASGPEDVHRRLAKLSEWAAACSALGIRAPDLPAWALEFARSGEDTDGWIEVLRGVERIAQQRIVQSLEAWREKTTARLVRLEAYAIDCRLEREEMNDALHAAKAGDVAKALARYQQVDRVLGLKEAHLDETRGELERLVALLREMRALEIQTPDEPEELERELERELRRGRLQPLKDRLRSTNEAAVRALARTVPTLVARWGEHLTRSRSEGGRVEADAATLARAARAVAAEEWGTALREVRRLGPLHPVPSAAAEPPRAA